MQPQLPPQQQVVVKFVPTIDEFDRQAALHHRLKSEHVARLVDTAANTSTPGGHGSTLGWGMPALVVEHGEYSLADFIARGKMPANEIKAAFEAIVRAVLALHSRGLAHCALQPEAFQLFGGTRWSAEIAPRSRRGIAPRDRAHISPPRSVPSSQATRQPRECERVRHAHAAQGSRRVLGSGGRPPSSRAGAARRGCRCGCCCRAPCCTKYADATAQATASAAAAIDVWSLGALLWQARAIHDRLSPKFVPTR